MINFKIKNENFFEIEIPGRTNEIYPRMYVARITTADRVKIYSNDLNRVLFDSISYLEFSVNGVVESDGVKAANALNEIIYASIATVTGASPFVTSTTLLQTPTGEMVFMQTVSDGTTKYLNADGTAYTGDVALLLPFAGNKEKEIILPKTAFTETQVGSDFEYLLPSTSIGMAVINSVQIGEYTSGNFVEQSFVVDAVQSNGDVKIITSVQLTNEFIRITGNK